VALSEEINSRVGKNIEKIPQSVMQSLTGMDYPGNVRELKNLLEHAVITSDNGILRLPETSNPASLPETNASNAFSPISLDDAQRQHITHVLDHTDDRIEGPGGAAEILGSSPAPCAIGLRSWVSSATIDGSKKARRTS
jgi:formate hydrogenlyase transcriptional activator